jgi:hypothetical protein
VDQLLDAPLDDPLLDLEVGDAEANEAAGGLVALEEHDAVPGTPKLLGGGHAGGAGADDGDGLPALLARWARLDPVLAPGAVGDRLLDLLDRDGVAFADLEHAGRFARCGAEPARELGEVVRRVKLLDRGLPALPVDEIVPIGYEVAERTAVVAEGHAAIHAARALRAQLVVWQRCEELAVIARTLARVTVLGPVTLDLEERAELAHQAGSGAAAGDPEAAALGGGSPAPAGAAAWACSCSASSRKTRL